MGLGGVHQEPWRRHMCLFLGLCLWSSPQQLPKLIPMKREALRVPGVRNTSEQKKKSIRFQPFHSASGLQRRKHYWDGRWALCVSCWKVFGFSRQGLGNGLGTLQLSSPHARECGASGIVCLPCVPNQAPWAPQSEQRWSNVWAGNKPRSSASFHLRHWICLCRG